MKFWYNKIILWTKKGTIRELIFEPNKVNIITGDCETGKSTILGIIDYCFFASGNIDSGPIKIPQTIINENVDWYGVKFCINDNMYTLARRSLINENIPVNEYYFSATGEIPEKLISNTSEKEIKEIINEEFKITSDVVIPYSGSKMKVGSKVSIKYFMLFNSQDDNTIINSDVFFGKQTFTKYKEALNRVFDIAIGISTPEDILITEKIREIESQISKYEKKQEISLKAQDLFNNEKLEIVKQAKAYGLLDEMCKDTDKSIDILRSYISIKKFNINEENSALEELTKQERTLKLYITNIKRFLNTYDEYHLVLANNQDSLKPIASIKKYLPENIENSISKKIISSLEKELIEIKSELKTDQASNFTLHNKLKLLQEELEEIISKKEIYESSESISKIEKYMFLGEIKNKLNLYDTPTGYDDYSDKINLCNENLELLKKASTDKGEHKQAVTKLLESIIKDLLYMCEDAMDTYKGYLPVLNHNQKKLELQKPNTTEVIKVAGSSSNTLFLHLCLMLGLHEVIINKKIPYVASYLVLDQPSRPYYENNTGKVNDRQRIIQVMQLLNDYIDRINKNYKEDFQIIVLEHIPPEIWYGMENIHLVQTFVDGNKLIRKEDMA